MENTIVSDYTVLTITSLGSHGDGIAHEAGITYYVAGALPGDEVEVLVSGSQRKNHQKVEFQRVLSPSEARVTPPCTYAEECGGCSLQHMGEALYYQHKKDILIQSVTKAGYDAACVKEVARVGAHTRRRTQFKVTSTKKLGYVKKKSHQIIAVDHCLILEQGIERAIVPLNKLLPTLPAIEAVDVTQADQGLDIVLYAKKMPSLSLAASLPVFARAHNIVRLSWHLDKELIPIYTADRVTVSADNSPIPLAEQSFLQATMHGQDVMISHIKQVLQEAKVKHVIDLYSGCGTFSVPIIKANIAKHVTAYEGSDAMVNALKAAVTINELHGKIEAYMCDLFTRPLQSKLLKKADAVIINPPRNGAAPQCAEIGKGGVSLVIMVSCNPTSFARDAAILKGYGYQLRYALPIDQFYMSSHLECLAVFER